MHFQSLLQNIIILYCAVMHQGNLAALAVMGMGVDIVRLSVCGPTRMCYPYRAIYIFRLAEPFQIRHLAARFVHIQCTILLEQCDSRAVIPPIFQTMQPFNQNLIGRTMAYITDNSTHKKS